MVNAEQNEFPPTFAPDADDLERRYPNHQPGVIFVCDRFESRTQLCFLPLAGTDLRPAGQVELLADGLIEAPRRPSLSGDGRFVIFDAHSIDNPIRPRAAFTRVHILDLSNGTVRRLTRDPYGSSHDLGASFNGDGRHFAMISNRTGLDHLHIAAVADGVPPGFGNAVVRAKGADWCHTRNEIVYANSRNFDGNNGLYIHDVETVTNIEVVTGLDKHTPKFSPSCERIAYVNGAGLHVVNRNGTGDRQVLADGDYPTWVDESRVIVHRTVEGNTDLYLFDVDTQQILRRLTVDPGVDAEPTFVKRIMQVTKTANPAPVPDGAQLTYTICVTNNGSVALNATITDTLPSQVIPNHVQVWTQLIEPRSAWTQSISVEVQDGYSGTLHNRVEVTTQEGVTGRASIVICANVCRAYLPVVLK
jgi:uncharacterized repeat protein (TIGR01451 family)